MKYPFILFILFLIQTNIYSQVDHWETAVYAEDSWRYFIGTSEPPSSWSLFGFDDLSWPEGSGSIGYGDGDDNTVIAPVGSIYMRRTFNVVDKSKIEPAIFHADYDDGFVAYLNGVEIARANLNGNPPLYNTWPPNLHEAELYQNGNPDIFYINAFELQSLINDGENVLAVQTHNYEGANSSDLTSSYWLSFGITDDSNDYGPTPSWFVSPEFTTPLPIVKINTGGVEIVDEPSIQGEMGIIWNGDGNLNSSLDYPDEFLGNISIEIRGQSSQSFPKVGYAIETKDENWEDLDVEFLNFPEEEDWILHGPYSDKTLIRNVLAMHLAESMGQYASRTRLVEVLINEEYRGVYVLMERIKRDESRVDIASLEIDDISGDELTGGYVFKVDKGEIDWTSQYNMANNPNEKLTFQYVSPKRAIILPEQEAYIQSYVDSFENAMLNPAVPFGGKYFYEYIDLESFVEHFIICELSKDVDAYRISSYLFKDKDSNGGLIHAGPVWDFNLAFGNANYCNGDTENGWVFYEHCGNNNPFWWEELLQNEMFLEALKCRWDELRAGPFSLSSIYGFIDDKTDLLETVVDRNFQRWPILDEYVWPNPVVTGSYEGEINHMKGYIADRIAWMDANIFGECEIVSSDKEIQERGFKISPNPASDKLFIEFDLDKKSDLKVSIIDAYGRISLVKGFPQLNSGAQVLELDFSQEAIASGLYFLVLRVDGVVFATEQIVFE